MFIIREEQMAVLSQYTNKQFEEKVINFLQHQFNDARQESREELKPTVREQIANARSYGLKTEHQLATYVTTAWLFGQKFDLNFSEVQENLKSECFADEKSNWLIQWAKENSKSLK